jgi:DNA polymerase-3 subunit alpha
LPTHRLIQSFDLSGETVSVRGQAFPRVCVIEDETTGERLCILGEEDISESVAASATAIGAIYAVRPAQEVWESLNLPDSSTGWRSHERFPSPGEIYEKHQEKTSLLTEPFVNLHSHSDFSALDGYSKISEMVEKVMEDGQSALALTDHGVAAGHPQLQVQCEAAGIHPVFGIEFYLVDDRHSRGGIKGAQYNYWHTTAWARDEAGLRNIWGLTTEANREGFFGRPRIDWDSLNRHSSGLYVSTGCLRGPVPQAILADEEDTTRERLARLLETFGDDLRVELHTNRLPDQIKVNHVLLGLAQELGIPPIAACDSHYSRSEHQPLHRVWVAMQTSTDLQDDSGLFSGDEQYHLMTAEEVKEALSDLPPDVVSEAMSNTVDLAFSCDARLEGRTQPPVFSKKGGSGKDTDRLVELCLSNWHKTQGKIHPQEAYEARFEREMKLLGSRHLSGYYLMVADYCSWARSHGILVGPGRGSGSGSLVAHLAGIVSIDPVEAGLLFERFLTEGRKALPDFDVDFPTSKREEITGYIAWRYGEENVVRVGTTIRVKNKGVVRALAKVLLKTLEIHYPDIETICGLIDVFESDTSGLGIAWDDLMEDGAEVLAPYVEKYPELFALCGELVGRVKTYGKHPAGVVISDESLTDQLPMRSGDDGQMISEFDMESLEILGFNKFDILTLRTLDTLQDALDLISLLDRWGGKRPPLEDFHEEFDDPQVWDEICAGHTLGIFQIETKPGTRMCRRQQPRSIRDLADVVTLVRPGPTRSGLTEVYLRRRDGEEEVSYLDERIKDVLKPTYGVILYQEQVLSICQRLAGYSLAESDEVRRILGKKKVDLVQKEGQRFVARCVEHGLDRQVAETLWEQLAEFSRYSFNLSHAYAYAVLAFYCAWLKVHYLPQFMVSVLSTVDKERIPEFITETRRFGYQVLPPDINLSGEGFSVHGLQVRYGLDSVKGIGAKSVAAISQGQPYEKIEDFMDRRGEAANMGVVKTLAKVGAFDSLFSNRRALEVLLEWQGSVSGSKDCIHRNDEHLGPGGLPCTFEWSSEQWNGKKPKPIPKRCTKACRQYVQGEPDVSHIVAYSEEEVRNREMEYLGVHLSSTPFDIFTPEFMEQEGVLDADLLNEASEGEHVVAGLLRRVKLHEDRRGRKMAFLTLYAINGDLDVTVFSDQFSAFRDSLKPNTLCLAFVNKNSRGLTLRHMEAL